MPAERRFARPMGSMRKAARREREFARRPDVHGTTEAKDTSRKMPRAAVTLVGAPPDGQDAAADAKFARLPKQTDLHPAGRCPTVLGDSMNHLDPNGTALPQRRTLALSLAAAAAVAAAFGFAAPASAQLEEQRLQEETVGIAGEPMIENEQVEPDQYSVGVGVTFATKYYFRGYIQDNDGLLNGGIISQPYVDVGFPIIAGEDDGFALAANIGTWNSFGSETADAPGAGPRTWYESDLYAGLTASTGNLEFGAVYTWYLYPFGGVPEIQEVGAFASYGISIGDNPDIDDEVTFDLGFGAGVYFETYDAGGSEDAYLELGVEPATAVEISGFDEPIALAFPVTVGLSLDDYYVDPATGDEEFFGYVSVAAAATFPLTPGGKYGTWTLTPAVEGLFLGDGLSTVDGDDVDLIGSLSLDLAF